MENSSTTNAATAAGLRFRRIPRQSFAAANLNVDPSLDENLEQSPHLNELVHCYKTDWVKDGSQYGHYESIGPVSFQNQIFEGPDTDIETETNLSSSRHMKGEDSTNDENSSTSGRKFSEATFSDQYNSLPYKHFGQSPLPAYEPAFDWENERSMVFGQRIPESHMSHHSRELKISVKVMSLTFQAGLVEPFYGTICLYDKERRDKLSEDFYFRILPTEIQDMLRQHLFVC